MKVCVYGIWHLGAVTAACLADAGHMTVGLVDDAAAAGRLAEGQPPLFEPGLEELFRSGLASGNLSFSSEKAASVADADVVWVTFDTPVDDEDRADVDYVVARIETLFPYLRDGSVLLVSSQLPVGSVARLEAAYRRQASGRSVAFACSPENLRLGKAIQVFRQPERVIVGVRDDRAKPTLAALFAPFSQNLIWVGIEAAELTKHALNAFLATCVTFINEIATIAEQVGADAREVEQALRSEPRIGPNAYIRPGAAFAGGTLARDVTFLREIAAEHALPLPMIGGIIESNRLHGGWSARRLGERLGDVRGRAIAVLGLSYKPGTDAVRRSLAVELVRTLAGAGAHVRAYDPQVRALADAPAGVVLTDNLAEALAGAEALALMTEWPEFRALDAALVLDAMARPLVVDQNGFLGHLASDPRVEFLTIGKPL